VPDLPQPGKSKRLFIRQGDVHRLPAPLFARPLVKAIGHDEAAPLFKGLPEAGLGGDGLHPGVDHFVADGLVRGPDGHQAPVVAVQDVASVVPGNGQDLLGGRHVVVGHRLPADGFIDREILLELLNVSKTDEPAAHGATPLSF